MSANSKTISLTTLILLLIVVAVISYAATWQFVKVRTEDVLPDGIYVGSIKVGGLTIPEALVKVEAKAPMPDRDIELVWSGGSYRLDIDKFKPELDLARIEMELEHVLPHGTFFERLYYKRDLKKSPKKVNIAYRFEEEAFNKLTAELDERIAIPPKDAEFVVNIFDQVSISQEKYGLKVDYNKLLTDLPHKYSYGETVIEVPTVVVAPNYTKEELLAFGIRGIVASFSTQFSLDNPNRVENIKLAAAALDGTILKPGEEFSFNAWVGPRVAELGYKEAQVLLAGGEITEDIGGGVCQVSTTLYNTALLSGLEIVERHPHSRPVSYVPAGRDAAVAFDYLDFRFINSQSNYILITAEVMGDRLLCKVFGSPLPSQIRLTTENMEEVPFQTVKGTTPRPGKTGLRVETYAISGSQKKLISQDFYKPVDQVVL